MNRDDAMDVLSTQLDRYRRMTWTELHSLVEDAFVLRNTHYEQVVGASGKSYQVRINVYWDDKRRRHLRVAGAVDDGGWKAFLPLTESFVVDPQGRVIGE